VDQRLHGAPGFRVNRELLAVSLLEPLVLPQNA
jgi:hypothetical protein